MHVIAGQAWGQAGPNTDWLVEGVAQAADGRCGSYSNADVLIGLATRRGWIPFSSVLTNFQALPDLRAYLHAAGFVDYLLRRVGPGPIKELWRHGATMDSMVAGHSLVSLGQEWRGSLQEASHPNPDELATIEAKGCG
ncbi:MAG: hypothetical protein IPO52_02285 [Gemmatimonadetes bacterium]|jgi:hypothetical protein|nr:hypothetical protein [Gemmatimonadota bacterium]MBP9898536.1 hypothetical protein [Gemmatimonadales bacterium]